MHNHTISRLLLVDERVWSGIAMAVLLLYILAPVAIVRLEATKKISGYVACGWILPILSGPVAMAAAALSIFGVPGSPAPNVAGGWEEALHAVLFHPFKLAPVLVLFVVSAFLLQPRHAKICALVFVGIAYAVMVSSAVHLWHGIRLMVAG